MSTLLIAGKLVGSLILTGAGLVGASRGLSDAIGHTEDLNVQAADFAAGLRHRAAAKKAAVKEMENSEAV